MLFRSADIANVADIATGIVDIITDIADIVTDIAGIADRVLRILRWKQVGVYKVSWGCPVTYTHSKYNACSYSHQLWPLPSATSKCRPKLNTKYISYLPQTLPYLFFALL